MKYCEEFAALLDLYVDGELEAADMIRVQEHLDSCPVCQSYVDDLLTIRAAFPEIEDTIVPEGFAEGVMSAIAASAPKKAKKRSTATPWKKIFVPMAACLTVVVMALPLSGLMNNTRMESAAPAEAPAAAPAAAMELYTADVADAAEDSPSEKVAEAPAAPAQEETQDVHYTATQAPAENESAAFTGAASRITDETGIVQDGSAEPAPAAKQTVSSPRAVITLPAEGANLELLMGRAADRVSEGRMEFDLPASDYELLFIQLDESGLDYLAEEYPDSTGDTILVIIEQEQVQQN